MQIVFLQKANQLPPQILLQHHQNEGMDGLAHLVRVYQDGVLTDDPGLTQLGNALVDGWDGEIDQSHHLRGGGVGFFGKDSKDLAVDFIHRNASSAVCMQKIEEHGLDMQLVGAECAFDGSRILSVSKFSCTEGSDSAVIRCSFLIRQVGVPGTLEII